MLAERLLQARLQLWRSAPQTRLFRWGLFWLRAADALAAVLWQGQLSLHAMSLVYTTLLSLAPLLALGFSLLKGLGIHNMLEPFLYESLRALGPTKALEVSQKVIGFVENIQVGVLGSLGVALLLYSALSLIQKLESAFNHVWGIVLQRSLSRRFGEYLAVLMVGPVVVFTALGLTASALDNRLVVWLSQLPALGFLLYISGTLVPYLLIVGMFTFLYAYIPNTPVRLRPAFIGGLFAGVLWQSASYAFAAFVASAGNYNAIYSGFAIVIFVLIWLYMGWLILLIGCQLVYFAQNPQRMNPLAPPLVFAGRAREQAGLALAARIAGGFARGEPPATRAALMLELDLNETTLADLAAALVGAGILADAGSHWLPARDPAQVSVSQVWQALRGGLPPQPAASSAAQASAGRFLAEAEAAVAAVGNSKLRDWAMAPPP